MLHIGMTPHPEIGEPLRWPTSNCIDSSSQGGPELKLQRSLVLFSYKVSPMVVSTSLIECHVTIEVLIHIPKKGLLNIFFVCI